MTTIQWPIAALQSKAIRYDRSAESRFALRTRTERLVNAPCASVCVNTAPDNVLNDSGEWYMNVWKTARPVQGCRDIVLTRMLSDKSQNRMDGTERVRENCFATKAFDVLLIVEWKWEKMDGWDEKVVRGMKSNLQDAARKYTWKRENGGRFKIEQTLIQSSVNSVCAISFVGKCWLIMYLWQIFDKSYIYYL